MTIVCSAQPCHTPGARVEISLAHEVGLPLLPDFLNGSAPASVRVSGHHLEVIDRFRAQP